MTYKKSDVYKRQALTWGRYFLGNMLPVTLGNMLGGLLVGWIAWYCFLRQKG